MGTSADRSAGSGGAWTPLKRATTSYIRTLGTSDSTDRAQRVLARHVPLLGGAQPAAGSARAGTAGAQRLGGLLASMGQGGLSQALTEAGLGELVGQDRFSVLDALMTFLTGDGQDLDAQAARDAACDVLDEMFGEADSWEQLVETEVNAEDVGVLLERFLALYIYNRVPVVAERLSRLTDPVAARQADEQMRQVIADLVAIHLPDDPFSVDWQGPPGRALIAEAIESAYTALTALAEGDHG